MELTVGHKKSPVNKNIQYLHKYNIIIQTNKYGMRIERHLPKTDKSVVRPAGERH